MRLHKFKSSRSVCLIVTEMLICMQVYKVAVLLGHVSD